MRACGMRPRCLDLTPCLSPRTSHLRGNSGVLKQAHRAGLAAATAPAIATEAAPGPDAEVWLTLDEISAPWMASLAQQNVRPTHPRPRQAAQGPVGSTEGPGYRFGPGPLSTLSELLHPQQRVKRPLTLEPTIPATVLTTNWMASQSHFIRFCELSASGHCIVITIRLFYTPNKGCDGLRPSPA